MFIYLADLDLLLAGADFSDLRSGGGAFQIVLQRNSIIATESCADAINIPSHLPVNSRQGAASAAEIGLVCCYKDSRYLLEIPK